MSQLIADGLVLSSVSFTLFFALVGFVSSIAVAPFPAKGIGKACLIISHIVWICFVYFSFFLAGFSFLI